MGDIADWLVEKLVCPLSKAPVVQVGDWIYSTDPETRRRYPIRDGIPNMLVDESETVDPEEFERVMARCGARKSEGRPGGDPPRKD
jgi:uncharacterized protein YbaR (Trm112 family)